MNALQKAIEVLGSQSALASAIGRAPQVVNNWVRRGNVPAENCPDIEKATNGAVRCEDLRPDVDWAYLRNSAAEPAPIPNPSPVDPEKADGGAAPTNSAPASGSGVPRTGGEPACMLSAI